jgi:hypothetical protein
MKRLTPALLSPLALGLLLSGAASAAELTLVNFGGANGNAQKVAYVEPFQKSTGTKVVTVEYNGELAKVKAMVETKKVSWDVVEIDGGDLTAPVTKACSKSWTWPRPSRRTTTSPKPPSANAAWVLSSGPPCWPTTPTSSRPHRPAGPISGTPRNTPASAACEGRSTTWSSR